jgi:hypothetical protein
MKFIIYFAPIFVLLTACEKSNTYNGEIFDTHVHFAGDVPNQLKNFEKHKIVKAAISSSWSNQEKYRTNAKTEFLIGLMFPCSNGIVPYSGQTCFSKGEEFPDSSWVRQQLVDKKIDFLGEVLNEYYGISDSTGFQLFW